MTFDGPKMVHSIFTMSSKCTTIKGPFIMALFRPHVQKNFKFFYVKKAREKSQAQKQRRRVGEP